MALLTSLYFSIPGDLADPPARIDFRPYGLDVCINDTTRTFFTLRQAYNYLRLMYGQEFGTEVVGMLARHAQKCRMVG